MDTERNEDLNPHSDEIERKVDAMLDPSIPDVPDLSSVKSPRAEEKPEKIIVISSSAAPKKSSKKSAPLSAPELPNQEPDDSTSDVQVPASLPPSKKDAKKIIIPIEHHDDEPKTPAVVTEPPPKIQLLKEKVTPVTKSIPLEEASTVAVAAQLDEAITALAADTNKSEKASLAGAPDLASSVAEGELPKELLAESDEVTDELAQTPDVIPIEDPAVINDPQTDKAVAEIVASEGDEILEIEDAVRDTDEDVQKPKKEKRRITQALAALLRKPAFRWIAVLFLLIGGTAAAAVPTSRYFVLNTAGVRVNSSLTVVDDSTKQPLKNVDVQIGDVRGKTDQEGKLTLNKVRLGSNALTIQKRAFAPIDKTVVVGLGSNPLGEFSLSPTGTQYTISATDFLSAAPLPKVAATSGQADALSDDKGVIKLTIDKPSEASFKVTLSLDGYRTEEITINPDDTAQQSTKLVPAKKHVYVSKRSGKYDVYSAYIDGKDEKVILAGSGNERDDMVLVPHPKDNVAAYVSTRPGQKNSEGFVLSNLVTIDLETGETNNVTSAEQIKVISWVDDRLVYVQIAAGASAETPDRYRLVSYNQKDGSTKELAKSNFFNDVIGIGSSVYYAPSSAFDTASAKLYRVNADGTNNETLYDKEVWNIFRTSYDHLALSVQQQWYDYRLGDAQPTKLNAAPADQVSRVYVDSPNGSNAVWVDNRDGKGVVLVYDKTTKTDKTLISESGLNYPVRWLSDSVLVYRVKTNQETADYAVSVNGGEPVKIHDVTNTAGLSRWL